MSEEKSKKPEFDPFAPWKQFQGPWMETWSKAMSEAVSGEDFTKAMGEYLDAYLQTSAPLRKQVEEAMEKYLQTMHMPTRNEVLGLAERLTHLEMRLDDLDAKMDDALDDLKAILQALETK